jgi:hypothetical protein
MMEFFEDEAAEDERKKRAKRDQHGADETDRPDIKYVWPAKLEHSPKRIKVEGFPNASSSQLKINIEPGDSNEERARIKTEPEEKESESEPVTPMTPIGSLSLAGYLRAVVNKEI